MNKTSLTLAILLFITALLSTRFWFALQAERATVAELRTGMADRASPDATDRPRSFSAPASAEPTTLKSSTPPNVPDAGPFGAFKESSDPEYMKAARRETRLSIAQRYPGLARELGLSREETSQLFDLLANQMSDLNDRQRMAKGGFDSRELSREQAKDVAALLGAKYPLFQEYAKTQPVRLQVAQLQRILEANDEKLSDDQAHQLTAVTIAERKRLAEEIAGSGGAGPATEFEQRRLQLVDESNARVIQSLRGNLSSAQLEALRITLDARLAAGRANLRAQSPDKLQ